MAIRGDLVGQGGARRKLDAVSRRINVASTERNFDSLTRRTRARAITREVTGVNSPVVQRFGV